MGLVDEKSSSWIKHTVRHWKQVYNEIQFVDGHIDTSNPLSSIFRNEPLATKLLTQSKEAASSSSKVTSSKKEESSRSQPEKTSPSNPEKKQSKGRFLYKIKELQCFLPSLNFF
jgi:hypothetical protein